MDEGLFFGRHHFDDPHDRPGPWGFSQLNVEDLGVASISGGSSSSLGGWGRSPLGRFVIDVRRRTEVDPGAVTDARARLHGRQAAHTPADLPGISRRASRGRPGPRRAPPP